MAIAHRVIQLVRLKSAPGSAVFFYASKDSEVDTGTLWARFCLSGHPCYFPRVLGQEMTFFQIKSLHQLRPGSFSVPEPSTEANVLCVTKQNPLLFSKAIVLVPGVAFSLTGKRIGYGKGYYDRFLSILKASGIRFISLGLAYDCQVEPDLPVESHDQRIDYLVTESGVVRCSYW